MTQTTPWVAYGNGRLRHPDGTVSSEHTSSLAAALSLAAPQDEIGVTGDHSRVTSDDKGLPYVPAIQLGTKPSQGGWHAFSSGGIVGLKVIGLDDRAIIPRIIVSQRYCYSGGLAWERLYIRCSSSLAGIMHSMGEVHTDMWYRDIEFINKWKARWGARTHGPTSGGFEDVYGEDFDEHLIYQDNTFDRMIIRRCAGIRCKRTTYQHENRVASGASSTGHLLIEELYSRECGEHGGAGITIGGHLGIVDVKHCDVVMGKHAAEDSYALVVWGPGDSHFMHLGHNRYATNIVRIHPRQRFHSKGGPTKGRPAIGISSCNDAMIAPCRLDGGPGSPDMWFAVPGGGGQNNSERFIGRGNAWNWPGMWSASPPEGKIKRGIQTLDKADVGAMTGQV